MLRKYSYNILNSSWTRCLVLCPFLKVRVFTAGYYIAITGTVSLKPWVCVTTACKMSSLAECTFGKSVFFWEIQTSGSQECKSFRNWRIFWLWRCWGISQWTLQATEPFSKSRWSWFWCFLSWSSKQVAHCFLNVHWRKWYEHSKHDQQCTGLASKARTIPGVWKRETHLAFWAVIGIIE